MTKSNMIKSPFTATATLALAAGIAAAPVSFDVAGSGIALKSSSAFARQGADDPAGHVRGGGGKDDGVNHKRRGGGKDDGANHR